ncbi:MAG TPA: BMC domain-containing protein, partial [Myxococcales bacterium]|nr:BMC domain-containing protein [Myxococcales bacterium]
MTHPALGLLEITGIARGLVVSDAMVKRARVELLRSHPIDPGKYLIVFAGPVAEVEEAMDAGIEVAADMVLDQLLLPNAHPALMPAIVGRGNADEPSSIAVIECHTLAGAVLGLDAALKFADVAVMEIRLGSGLAGKGFFILTGDLPDVEAGVEAAMELAGPGADSEIIASPHPDFL